MDFIQELFKDFKKEVVVFIITGVGSLLWSYFLRRKTHRLYRLVRRKLLFWFNKRHSNFKFSTIIGLLIFVMTSLILSVMVYQNRDRNYEINLIAANNPNGENNKFDSIPVLFIKSNPPTSKVLTRNNVVDDVTAFNGIYSFDKEIADNVDVKILNSNNFKVDSVKIVKEKINVFLSQSFKYSIWLREAHSGDSIKFNENYPDYELKYETHAIKGEWDKDILKFNYHENSLNGIGLEFKGSHDFKLIEPLPILNVGRVTPIDVTRIYRYFFDVYIDDNDKIGFPNLKLKIYTEDSILNQVIELNKNNLNRIYSATNEDIDLTKTTNIVYYEIINPSEYLVNAGTLEYNNTIGIEKKQKDQPKTFQVIGTIFKRIEGNIRFIQDVKIAVSTKESSFETKTNDQGIFSFPIKGNNEIIDLEFTIRDQKIGKAQYSLRQKKRLNFEEPLRRGYQYTIDAKPSD